ncbi:MAG TPA: error-prone DNA polymerase [Acidimicrobiales bacterium]|nr:error-prone DNA polymerase [Acidimicrobiales bacterium]
MVPAEPAYAELHCHSNFSFLDGASHPEALVDEAARRGLSALALTDHDGLYGVVRFHEAARAAGLATVFGAELTLSPAGPRTGEPDPTGHHLVVLARDPAGYARLSRKLADAHLAGGEKGRPVVQLEDLAEAHGGHWQVLTGCRKGPVPAALLSEGPRAARRQLDRLVDVFGRDRLAVELWDHGDPVDSTRNDALALLAAQAGVDLVATNNVHYARPADFPLATTVAAVRAGRPLDQLAGWLPASASAALRSGAEQARRFARWPGAVARAAEIGAACAFDLQLMAPRLPAFEVPAGHTEQSWLTKLVEREAPHRYGKRGPGAVTGAWERLDHELSVIGEQGFPGYFLTVWEIVEFCRTQNIYCQGRGSAATSAVCYVLGITIVDAVHHHLLFERFLSPIREGAPDIDLDIESGRREEVIQHVYERYGRRHAAQVANVITYRHRSAVREVGKALGHDAEEIDGWAKATDRGQALDDRADIPPLVRGVAGQLLGFPRHLGIHSGGMVICDRPVVDVCPVEPARMPNRTVLQWDKDDCATIKLVKFDLLGLGMLEALHHMVDLIREHHGVEIDRANLPQDDPAVYDLLCRADTVGVFQVESRAQMGTLPRVRPQNLYELAIEVALIRPGPIQGDAVHPYIRRKQGKEPVVYLHPSLERIMKPELERILERTKGVPLFQEQLMEITVEVAGLSAVEADELRRAISHKRSGELMTGLRDRLFAGMADRGVPVDVQRDIFDRLASFTSFGFPESHALSFAALVYSSAWLKLHYPAAFTSGLLNAQPMGFWSPQSLLADAKRHGVVVHRPDVNASAAGARPATVDPADEIGRAASPGRRLDPARPAIRLGLASVRFVGPAAAERLAVGQPWNSQEELVRRGGLTRPQLEALALAGALDGLSGDEPSRSRRTLVWTAGAAAQATPGHLPGIVTGATAPALPVPTPMEAIADDLWAIGVTPERTAIELARPALTRRGVVPARTLFDGPVDGRVTVAGVVTHRQQPETARGAVFLNLEDETGLVNVICSPGAWTRWRSVARMSPALVVRGRLERSDGVVNVVAERFEPLLLGPVPGSRDFR